MHPFIDSFLACVTERYKGTHIWKTAHIKSRQVWPGLFLNSTPMATERPKPCDRDLRSERRQLSQSDTAMTLDC